MNRDKALLRNFGLKANSLYWGPQHERYAGMILDATESRRMIGVIGRYGNGKSMLVRHTLESVEEERDLVIVYVNQPDRERLRIGQIMTTMIDQISGESPRRDLMARSTQVARVLGESVLAQKNEVVLVVENAHRLHANTLLALKDLRESAMYRGQPFLFSVVLVGQEGLRAKLDKYGEVRYRTRHVELTASKGWMDYPERVRYLAAIYKDTIDPSTRKRLASLFEGPLEMDHYIEQKLELMRDAGIDKLDERNVPMTLGEQRQALKISLRDLSKMSGVPKSTISDVERGTSDNQEAIEQVQGALDEIAEKRTGRAA